MLVDVQVIPHSEQRYETVGDWWWGDLELESGYGKVVEPDSLSIRVSKLSDPRHELLVFVHELMEALVCREMKVSQEAVDAWDERYERAREVLIDNIEHNTRDPKSIQLECGCYCTEHSEPGDDIHAPYHGAHHLATVAEKLFASVIGVSWVKYNEEVENL